MKPSPAAVLALLLGACQAAHALDSARAITQYVRRVWQLPDGLPSQIVYSITQTRDGYLWLGTSAGLARFDGVRVAVFDKGNTPELLSNMVWAVQASRDGGLWVGTSQGLNRFDRGRMTAFPGNAALPDRFVQALIEDRHGRLWIGTPGGVAVMEGGTIRATFPRAPAGASSISQLLEDRSGTIWVTTNAGVAAIDGNALKPGAAGDALADLTHVWNERDGRVCTLAARQVRCLDQGTWRPRGERVESLPDGVASVFPDRDGNLWIGATGTAGVVRLSAGKASAYAASEPLVGHALVLAFFEDREGNLWIGSSGFGLARVTDGRLAIFGKAEGLREDRISDVTAGPSGVVWVASRIGLDRFADGEWTAFTHPSLPVGAIEAVFADADGTLWFTHRQSTRLYHLAGDTAASYPAAMVGGVFMITPAREGGLWLAGSKGLFRFTGGRIEDTPVTRLSVSVAREGRDGGLWIGSPSEGLLYRRGTTLSAYSTKNGLPSNAVGDLLEDAAGTLWIATDETGLVRFKDGRFTSYAARAGLADFVCSVFEDGQQALWLNTRKGIFRVDKREFDEMDAGGRARLTPALYDGSSGLRRAQCLIRAEHLTDVTLRFRIEREARTLARIDHPGVAALVDSGELDSGSVFLVMEVLRGLDLGQTIARDGPGSPAQVARVVRETAAALAAAHRRGVIHRDVKPANIFLATAPGGFVTKVVDFGLATSGHVDVRVTQSGIMVGTPAYMSPEQVQGLPLDPRSDLYSLAIVADEALTGRRAVESQDVGGVLIDVIYKTIPPASSVIPALAPIDPALAAALGKQPADRPDLEAWARDFAAALERLPEGAHRWRDVLAPGGPE